MMINHDFTTALVLSLSLTPSCWLVQYILTISSWIKQYCILGCQCFVQKFTPARENYEP